MDKNISQKAWAGEFMDFLEAEPVQPPQALSESIYKRIEYDLQIPLWKTLLKLGTIQAVVALATLLICPQFEVDFVIIGHDDAHLKALLGETAYMGLCGAIFLTSGTLMATLLLTVDELRTIKKNQYGYFFLASTLGLVIFYKLGAPAAPSAYAAWFMGAFIGCVLCYELVKGIKELFPLRSKKA